MDTPPTEEQLRELLEERNREVAELRRRVQDLELTGTRFVSAASHAVMNPITIIQSYLEIVLSDLQGGLSNEQVEFVTTAHAATVRLNRLVHGIVELAALETGVAELDTSEIDLPTLIVDVCGARGPLADEGAVDLSVSIAPGLPTISADPERLKNAIDALVENAVQWTPREGRVAVTASVRGGDLVVAVTDSGPGIADDLQTRIFEPFVRQSREDGAPRRGSGLGLSVACRQIEAMGGRIDVTSTVGKGSTFEIVMPAKGDVRGQRIERA